MKAIVAISDNRVIGHKKQLPWHIPEDLKFFRRTTVGHILIMGRNTFESLPSWGLKDRICVVLTTRPIDGHVDSNNRVIFVDIDNLDTTLKNLAESHPYKTMFVVGGKRIFELFEDRIQEFIVTHIHKDVVGDVFLEGDFGRFSNRRTIDHKSSDYRPLSYARSASESSTLPHPEQMFCDTEKCWISRVVYTR